MTRPSPYDAFADLYDTWTREYAGDVAFYVDRAREAGGPVVELGVGTGRVAVPTAEAGFAVIGIDGSERMLEACRRRAQEAGVAHLIDLRVGDIVEPPVEEQVPLVTCPYRTMSHLKSEKERRRALQAINRILLPGGRFAFDVFAPEPGGERDDEKWFEVAAGIEEQARWDSERRAITLRMRGSDFETTLEWAWVTPEEWRALLEEAGFEIHACYGWFDLRPAVGPITVWIARRPAIV
jgi:SAM-dependent methyltransferase